VITHGFQPGTGFVSPPVEDGKWMFEMAESIVERTGGHGCILLYKKSSGNFEVIPESQCSVGERVLLFDWAQESDLDTKGYSEAAADALFAALVTAEKQGLADLKEIHFIGHSRGTVVNTLTVERLLVLKKQYPGFYPLLSIDQVTNLDPHDWGLVSTITSDLNDAHPDITISIPQTTNPNNGTIAWNGVFSDTYWQDYLPPVGERPNLHGRPVQGSMNFHWELNDQNNYLKHTNIHADGYSRTIRENMEIEGGGYHLSRIAKGIKKRPPEIYGGQEPTFSFYQNLKIGANERVRGIVNGSFDRGNSTFSSIPGWEYHGGGFNNAGLKSGFLLLSKVGSTPCDLTHNRFFIPPDANKITFKEKIFSTGPGIKKAVLKVKINDEILSAEEIESATVSWEENEINISRYANSVVTLTFELEYPLTPASPIRIGIDEVRLSKKISTTFPTLFLFDLSGSMNELGNSNKPKIEEAKAAARSTLQTIQNNNRQGVVQEVGIKAFAGGCVADPTVFVTNGFLTRLGEVETAIDRIGMPGGGTPLAEAIESSSRELEEYVRQNDRKQAKLIILSDGEATCAKIRPDDVYAFGQNGRLTRTITANQQANSTNTPIKYYTIGFNIAPGSPAERDLQYLAQVSGGKYLNAQNQFQLTRAFQRFNRVYAPKPAPALSDIPTVSEAVFDRGVASIYEGDFPEGLEQCSSYVELHAEDCHGVFNLALMLEANEYYKLAIAKYEKYLQLCPGASDQAWVRRQIETLEKDYQAYLEFNRKVVISDMEYLNLHFKKIQNGESMTLATEFIAFLKEKWSYYKNLPAILEIDTRIFEVNAAAVFRGLKSCADIIQRNPEKWDRDATPVLSRTYLNMERLLKTF